MPVPEHDHLRLHLDDRIDEETRPCEQRQLPVGLDENKRRPVSPDKPPPALVLDVVGEQVLPRDPGVLGKLGRDRIRSSDTGLDQPVPLALVVFLDGVGIGDQKGFDGLFVSFVVRIASLYGSPEQSSAWTPGGA